MEWFALSIELIDALAWPAAVVILVVLFRRSLIDRIPDLQSLRTPGGFEASFARRLGQVERRAEELVHATEPVSPPEEREGSAPDLEFLAETFPNAAVLEAWTQIERELERLAGRVDLEPPRRRSVVGLIRALEERDLLGPIGARLLRDLRTLRNNAAHASEFDVTVDAAETFVRTVLLVLEMLRGLPGHSTLAVPLETYERMTDRELEQFAHLDPNIRLGVPARYRSPDGRTWAIFDDPRLAPTTAARIEELLGCPVVRSAGVPEGWRPVQFPES